jgi:hypothetical protein
MAAHRDDAFFREAVRSVISQEDVDWELVVVDDGSENAQVSAWLEGLAHAKVRCVRREHSGGPYVAAMDGLPLCTGDVVARHDSDDVSFPLRLKTLAAVLDADANLGAAACLPALVDERGQDVGRFSGPCTPEEIAQVASFRMPVIHPSMAIRTGLLRQLGYRREFFTAGDFDLVSRLVEGHRMCALPVSLYGYRQHGAAMSATRAAAQAAYAGAVLLMSARRAACRPEGLGQAMELARVAAAQNETRDAVALAFSAHLYAEGFMPQATYLARQAVGGEAPLKALAQTARCAVSGLAAQPRRALRAFRMAAGSPVKAAMENLR